MHSLISQEISQILNGEHSNPFSILGMHKMSDKKEKGIVVRAYFPNAKEVYILEVGSKQRYTCKKVYEEGIFEALFDKKSEFFTYQLEVVEETGHQFITEDPYCFPPVISEYDLYLFNEGTHERIYEKLGSHFITVNDVEGTVFAVWAPCAKRVSVVGGFNQWDGRRHQMRRRGSSGVWEIFIPGLKTSEAYKYEIKTPHNEIYVKSDPYAFYAELRPATASISYSLEGYQWKDNLWIEERQKSNMLEKPISIYEAHMGTWKKRVDDDDNGFYNYREIADQMVPYIKEMGYTHIELLPIAEHPFDGSWGYQVTGYYAATSRYGKPEDFMYFVDLCHQHEIGVILDWVPAHFPKDGHGLARFDGTALYEHHDPLQGEHPDWGTHIFNYGRNEVKNFLISNAVFWFDKFHIDGIRVDALASILYLNYGKKEGNFIPNKWGGNENIEAIEFIRQLNETVHKNFPGAMMTAEDSTNWPLVTKPPYMGGLGFTFKWNMGWMNDYLKYIKRDPIHRKYHQNDITFSLMYAFAENYVLALSHDEVVHGKCSLLNKMPGDYWRKFAGLRTSLSYMYGHPGKKLLFMGSEFGQFIEWNDKKSLDWFMLDYEMHSKMQRFMKELNHLYKSEKALYEVDFDWSGFEWISCSDTDNSILSFVRKGKNPEDMLVFVSNFTPNVHDHYRIGVPKDAFYKEILNSDSEIYGGSNVGNCGGLHSEPIGADGRPHSIAIRIPPLATVVFKPIVEK